MSIPPYSAILPDHSFSGFLCAAALASCCSVGSGVGSSLMPGCRVASNSRFALSALSCASRAVCSSASQRSFSPSYSPESALYYRERSLYDVSCRRSWKRLTSSRPRSAAITRARTAMAILCRMIFFSAPSSLGLPEKKRCPPRIRRVLPEEPPPPALPAAPEAAPADRYPALSGDSAPAVWHSCSPARLS